jgi:hypothetical protein
MIVKGTFTTGSPIEDLQQHVKAGDESDRRPQQGEKSEGVLSYGNTFPPRRRFAFYGLGSTSVICGTITDSVGKPFGCIDRLSHLHTMRTRQNPFGGHGEDSLAKGRSV